MEEYEVVVRNDSCCLYYVVYQHAESEEEAVEIVTDSMLNNTQIYVRS